jgi:hypothetical protein
MCNRMIHVRFSENFQYPLIIIKYLFLFYIIMEPLFVRLSPCLKEPKGGNFNHLVKKHHRNGAHKMKAITYYLKTLPILFDGS